MRIIVSVPIESDASRIATIHIAAMQPNILLHAQFPNPSSQESLHGFLVRDTLDHLRDPTRKGVLVARDQESGTIVGFVKWEMPPAAGEKHQELEWPGDCEKEWIDRYDKAVQKERERAIGDLRCCHPEFRGRGTGSLLARAVLDKAAEVGWPVYLESTLEAVGVYTKLGFERVGGFKMSVPSRLASAETKTYEEVCLLRRASQAHDGK